MERFGRFEFDATGIEFGADLVWSELQAPFLEFAQSDSDRFTTQLAAAVIPAGGFALFGAARTVWNLLGPDFAHPCYDALRMDALEFFRARGVPGNRLSAGDREFWRLHRGPDEPWLVGRPPPAPGAALPPLATGELRPVARMSAGPHAETVYARADVQDGCVAVVEACGRGRDPAGCRFDWFGAATQYELYLRIGEALQVPAHWVADELMPFIPFSAPSL
ncbi:hypothetical protein ACIOC1_05935 [Streptomyces sp. NPDC088197]|uniref:hypothetical protein n=1 Tax=unclassified Streptomyces TaxID=2593676 RepID=UPI00339FC9B3